MLGRREWSRAELTARLTARGFNPDEVEAAVARLADSRSLDERRAAFAHVRTASRLKGRGRLRIQRELEVRGFSRDVVREALAEIPPDQDLDGITRFIDRKRRTLDNTPAGRRRLFNQLIRRGFSAEMIAKVLKKA